MPPTLLFGHSACCCCCADKSRRLHLRRRRRRIGDEEWEDEELSIIEDDARAWMKDTRRTCADFFKTMALPGHPERRIAGRATLLTKTRGMNQLTRLALSNTICALIQPPKAIPPPVAAVTPQPTEGPVWVIWEGAPPASLPLQFSQSSLGAAREIGQGLFRAYGIANRFKVLTSPGGTLLYSI